jgi:hypothetical protein
MKLRTINESSDIANGDVTMEQLIDDLAKNISSQIQNSSGTTKFINVARYVVSILKSSAISITDEELKQVVDEIVKQNKVEWESKIKNITVVPGNIDLASKS